MTSKVERYEIKEKLYESERTQVYRGYRTYDHLPVILKILRPEAATQERITSFKHEFDIISKLNLPGAAKALGLEDYEDSLMIVVEDTGGDTLSRALQQAPLPLIDSLKLMITLTDTVGLIHEKHIIHKDINPSNIVFNPKTKQVNLIDFSLADEVPERSIALKPPMLLEGTIEYISPEQTGRMNRTVDYRTDFYSLGVTFYQMLTGRLPF